MIMQLTPYIIFNNGNCEEALGFYSRAMGGTVGHISRYADSPQENRMGMADDKIMHTQFTMDGQPLFMASDGPTDGKDSGMVHLSLNFTDAAAVKSTFEKLSEGGTVQMPLQDTFWGATFGMVHDKYGIKWMVNYDKPKG